MLFYDNGEKIEKPHVFQLYDSSKVMGEYRSCIWLNAGDHDIWIRFRNPAMEHSTQYEGPEWRHRVTLSQRTPYPLMVPERWDPFHDGQREWAIHGGLSSSSMEYTTPLLGGVCKVSAYSSSALNAVWTSPGMNFSMVPSQAGHLRDILVTTFDQMQKRIFDFADLVQQKRSPAAKVALGGKVECPTHKYAYDAAKGCPWC